MSLVDAEAGGAHTNTLVIHIMSQKGRAEVHQQGHSRTGTLDIWALSSCSPSTFLTREWKKQHLMQQVLSNPTKQRF